MKEAKQVKQQQVEQNRLGLKNMESFILELILLVYPLILVLEGVLLRPYYLLLVLAIITGIGSYLLFSAMPYSIAKGFIISIAMMIPFYFVLLPLSVVIFMFVYVFWRMHSNFGTDRFIRIPFILINMIIFTCFYLFTRNFLLKAHALEVNKIHVTLFILTTVLFISIRFILIWLNARHLEGFRPMEAAKVFGGLLGVGIIGFLAVYYLIFYVRFAIIAVAGFLFGGIFMFLAKAATPAIDAWADWMFYLRYRDALEEEVEIEGEFLPEEALPLNEVPISILDIVFSVAGIVLAVVVLLLFIKYRKAIIKDAEGHRYSFRSGGRKKKKKEAQLTYDYSEATNAVRTAYRGI